jgi:hypothetical protein
MQHFSCVSPLRAVALNPKKLVILITGKLGKLICIAKTNSNTGLDAKILSTEAKLYFF